MKTRLAIFFLLLSLCAFADRRTQLASQKAPSGGGLSSGLVLLWKLDEASGTRAATIGGLNLTDNNTVGQAAGPASLGNAASFVSGNSEFLHHADNAALRLGDFNDHWVMWFYPLSSGSGAEIIIGKDDVGDRGMIIYADFNNARPVFGAPDATSANQECINFDLLSYDAWNMLDWGYDKNAGEWFIRLNNGTKETCTYPNPLANTAVFEVGARNYSGFEGYFGGRVCYLMRWNRILSAGEITQLYNSGNGLPYPF